MLKNLKLLRSRAGISQQGLADQVGVSQQSINQYENHSVEPDIEMLIRLANYFQVSVDYLIGRTDIPAPSSQQPSFPLSEHEKQLITKFRKMGDEQQRCIQHLINWL